MIKIFRLIHCTPEKSHHRISVETLWRLYTNTFVFTRKARSVNRFGGNGRFCINRTKILSAPDLIFLVNFVNITFKLNLKVTYLQLK